MGRLTDAAKGLLSAVFSRDSEERQHAEPPITKKKRNGNSIPFMGQAAPGTEGLEDRLETSFNFVNRLVDYEHMDMYPELNTANDIHADDSTQPDSIDGHVITIESDDQATKDLLDVLFHQTLRQDENCWSEVRELCKLGNCMREIMVTDQGVVGLEYMSPATVRRVETREDALIGFVQDPTAAFNMNPEMVKAIIAEKAEPPENTAVFDDWQVVHWRLRSIHPGAHYGYAVLEGARWIFKRLVMLEDTTIGNQVSRMPRYVFNLEVGKKNPRETRRYITEARQQFTKKKTVDPGTGQQDLRYNAPGFDENVYVPMRNGVKAVEIDTLSLPDVFSTDTLTYFQNKLLSAVKVPKSRLNFDEGRDASAILSNIDVQFARTVLRIQTEYRSGLRKVGNVHLSALGIDPKTVEWEVYMTVPSGIYELAQMEVRNAKANFAAQMRDFVSLELILKEIFGYSDEEVQKIKVQRAEEAKSEMKLQASFAENFGDELRHDSKAEGARTDTELKLLRRQMAEILHGDHKTRNRILEVRGLLKELKAAQPRPHRNGRIPVDGELA